MVLVDREGWSLVFQPTELVSRLVLTIPSYLGSVGSMSAPLGEDRLIGFLKDIPPFYWTIPYVGKRYPGVPNEGDLGEGANCQRYSFSVLAFFGFTIPDFRSSDLWQDTVATRRVSSPQPLDLLLFNRSDGPWGAHVGLYVADNAVLHLCKEIGFPEVWKLEDFSQRPRYRYLVGTKRVRAVEERTHR